VTDLPKHIGPFEVRDRLGQGGMGMVYLAYDPMLDRPVAIKVLRVPDEETRRRFLREARLAAKVHHPHIVSIYAVGEHESQPYLAMEYIAGHTLSAVIRSGDPVPLAKKVTWLAELCAGLGHAHQHGIVHRDVKPSNLLISRDSERLRLLDFGIAHGQEAGGMTMAGMVIGTPQYMSPEQVTGRQVDARSDIFSVGLVAYELLTGRQAFGGENLFDISRRIVSEQPTPLASICQDAPMTLVRIVEKCLEKTPETRPPDARQLERDLLTLARRLDPEHTLAVEPPTEPTIVIETPSIGMAEEPGTAAAALSARVREAVEAGRLAEAEQLLRDLEARHARTPGLSGLRVLVDEARQLSQAIHLAGDAERALDRANLTEARALLEDIERLAPRWTGLMPLRQQLQARQHQQRVADAIERVHANLEAGQLEEAEPALRQLAGLAPSHPELAALRSRYHARLAAQQASVLAGNARVALQGDQLDDAAALVAEALAIDAGNDDALAVQEMVGQRRRAQRVARAVQKVQAALDAGQAVTARRLLEQLVRLDGAHPELDSMRRRVERLEAGEEPESTVSGARRREEPAQTADAASMPAVPAAPAAMPHAAASAAASGPGGTDDRPAAKVAPPRTQRTPRGPVDAGDMEISHAALPRPAAEQPARSEPVRSGRRWPGVAAAALLALLIGGGYAAWRWSPAAGDPPPLTATAEAASMADADEPAVDAAAPTEDVLTPPAAPEPASIPAPEPASAPPADAGRDVLRRVQQLAGSGRYADAFAALAQAEGLTPAVVRTEQRRLAEQAQQRAAVARQTASDFNAGSTEAFTQGASRQTTGEDHLAGGRLRQAVTEFVRAHDSFEQAIATRAAGTRTPPPPAPPPPAPALAEQAAPAAPAPDGAGTAARVGASGSPAVVVELMAPWTNEHVRQVLAQWREYYEARNLTGLQRLWPTMDSAWERQFRGAFGVPGELQWIPQQQRLVRQPDQYTVTTTVLNITPLPEGAGSRTANATLNLTFVIAPKDGALVISSVRQR
jgi:eukaryotic-like serine/threonine-protein kinase